VIYTGGGVVRQFMHSGCGLETVCRIPTRDPQESDGRRRPMKRL